MHLSEEKDISAQSDSGSDNHTDDFTGTNFTQWTDNTSCRPNVPVVHRLVQSPSQLGQSHSTSVMDLPHLGFWPQDKEDKLHPGGN
jgi:hypothetical protein